MKPKKSALVRQSLFATVLAVSLLIIPTACVVEGPEVPAADDGFSALCAEQAGRHDGRRIVCADVAAIDQTLVYNRFGSFNPFGMMYALRRDLSPLTDLSAADTADADSAVTAALGSGASAEPVDGESPTPTMPRVLTAAECAALTGTEPGHIDSELAAGNVRLKDCKRARPMTLRVNVGDMLLVRVSNLLHQPKEPGNETALQGPGFSEDFCRGGHTRDKNRSDAYDAVSRDAVSGEGVPSELTRRLAHGEVSCAELPSGASTDSDEPVADQAEDQAEPTHPRETHADWPSTRGVNFVLQGLEPVPDPVTGKVHGACLGIDSVAPDDDFLCLYSVDQEGTYFLGSDAAPAGGEGDGGSIVHGLFGAVLAERQGSRWYRSQTSRAAFDAVWPSAGGEAPRHSRTGMLDYEKTNEQGVPFLNMARPVDGVAQQDFADATAVELVHSDLNAIVYCDTGAPNEDCVPREEQSGQASRSDSSDDSSNSFTASSESADDTSVSETAGKESVSEGPTQEPAFAAFREFSVFFHDELKTFYTKNFDDIPTLGQMAGVKDGFALNYGASGMGSILMANRKGIGPAADCMECLYEEFFLTSWANGDPALLERFTDDPSNVHHSYLNDPVVFRNFHAGPKETHVFHLHAHQWFSGNDPSRGTYLDSQTVAPQQGFTYNIYHGGRRDIDGESKGWWDTQGSGNRNRTLGDSIFHCHLYPHFAQGMWALWRVHDVLEDGSRLLPDGQAQEGLSIDFPEPGGHKRLGSIDRVSGAWLEEQRGTPIPAIIPLPGEVVPLLPTYADTGSDAGDDNTDLTANAGAVDAETPMPGFPFYVAGEPGHRPPQAPLDIAQDLGPSPTDDPDKDERTLTGKWLDGGIGRHVIKDGSERQLGVQIPEVDLLSLGEEQRSEFVSQVVAKSFALGDLSGHLTKANIEVLDNLGTRLERGAMGFHFNGLLFDPDDTHAEDRLILKDAHGADVSVEPGADDTHGEYASLRMAKPGNSPLDNSPLDDDPGGDSGDDTSIFAVNGSAPKPGAPFADPCGAPDTLSQSLALDGGDPLFNGHGALAAYSADPYLLGFRRYEVSAVQLDLIVNQAGWHDPQTRINVLTAKSDNYKESTISDRISPVVSDNDEPFFFRALSGECIEYRHTNEVPKELELDDFQVKTPTDTIGQHIHLVKFDVTSSDGSGNGWNYEDGTFAADELSLRRCAATLGEVGGDGEWRAPAATECIDGEPAQKDVWRLPLTENRDRFQTTVQRWFADPILSRDENDIDQDRTLRTVFTHDHFGPSSIQQHGFYSALVVEPGVSVGDDGSVQTDLDKVCEADGENCVEPLLTAERLTSVAWGSDVLTGTHKQVLLQGDDPIHPDFREFALSIADFALLYDPRDRSSEDEFNRNTLGLPVADAEGDIAASGNQGMKRLVCESNWRLDADRLDAVCGNHALTDDEDGSRYFEGDVPPAWVAGGRNQDKRHRNLTQGDLISATVGDNEVAALREHAIRYRQRAASVDGAGEPDGESGDEAAATLARPVAPPARPEAISVDHHDPYLVNYRGAPIPLRIGDKLAADIPSEQSSDCQPKRMARQGRSTQANGGADADSEVVTALVDGSFGECSVARQVEGAEGDMGAALMSAMHGDPETPLMEAYQGERMVFRLIQGAQEVQHTFNIAGLAFKRNLDQSFASGTQPLGLSAKFKSKPSLHQQCFAATTGGRPAEYRSWLDSSPNDPDSPLNVSDSTDTEEVATAAYWQEYERLLAECDNIEGFTFAQEVGISEHFEMQGSLRSDVSPSAEFVSPGVASTDPTGDDITPADLPAALDTESGPESDEDGPPDYLYNFGSVDALWNGAWGLLRIYPDPDEPIPASDAHDAGQRIGTRLGESAITDDDETLFEEVQEIPAIAGLACPRARDGEPPVQHTEAVIAALETRQLWPQGTPYGSGRRDPDGLMLALLPPESLVEGGFRAPDAQWRNLDQASVLAAIADRYTQGPMPMTLRVNAGDCVRVRFVNLLEESDEGGLRDLLGDAELPPIVGLNADPAYQGVVTETDTLDPTQLHRVGTLARPASGVRVEGLRPSAALSLSIGLPGMNLISDVPLSYGNNREALPPYRAGAAVPISDELRFFAGRYRLDIDGSRGLDAIARQLSEDAREYLVASVGGWLSGGAQPIPAAGSSASDLSAALSFDTAANRRSDSGFLELLGEPYVLVLRESLGLDLPADPDNPEATPGMVLDGTDDSIEQLVDSYCAASPTDTCRSDVFLAVKSLQFHLGQRMLDALDDRTHWIPYAFGAVPVRSVSDVISHAQHGLFGSIDVLPSNWPLTEAHGVASTSVDADDATIHYRSMSWKDKVDTTVGAIESAGSAGTEDRRSVLEGDPAVYEMSVELPDGSRQTRRVREFVLYYQDGLNLWDDDSRIDWQWSDGGPVRVPVQVADAVPLLGAANEAGAEPGDSTLAALKTVPDCPVCDDSYDRGEYAVNYRSPAFAELLNRQLPAAMKIDGSVEASDDMNVYTFPADYLDPEDASLVPDNALRLQACPGEEVVIRVVHPGGRARQRAFVMNGYSYEDLFPGFGVPRSALLAPGKSISAWLTPDAIAGRTSLWHDGPAGIRSGGVWGLLDVAEEEEACPG